MANSRKPKIETAIEPYRARALRDITFHSLTIAAGDIFMTDQIPFDPKAMELIL